MHDFADLPFAERVSPTPGLIVARRGFLATIAAACAAAQLPGARPQWQERAAAQGEGAAAKGFTVEEFVREVAPVCRELVADTSARGQDRYLFALASYAVRLGDVPIPKWGKDSNGHRIGANHGPDPFTVLHWELEPKAVIRPHPHLYGNVVTLGLAGEAIVHNYEQLGARDVDAKGPIRVVRTVDQVLRPGDVNLVSLERHYVHGFVAGDRGARGLDLTTRIRERRETPVLEVGAPVAGAAATFEARWLAE